MNTEAREVPLMLILIGRRISVAKAKIKDHLPCLVMLPNDNVPHITRSSLSL